MITKEFFNTIFPTKGLDARKFNLVRERDELISALNQLLPVYKINSYLRLCAFLSCCGVETDYFRTSEEYASGSAYEGRADLGNTQPGDGRRFKGSSLIQTTGRSNFLRVLIRFVNKLTGKNYTAKDSIAAMTDANRLGVNFLKYPEMLRENIEIAVEAACIFWEENNLNSFADRKQIKELNGIVNRGDARKTALGWDKRNELYSLCLRRIPQNFSFSAALPIVSTAGNGLGDIDVASSNNPVVLTPTDDDSGFDLPDLDLDTAKQRLNDCAEVAKRPGVKGLLSVIFTKFCFYFGLVWESGLSGKVLLVIGGLLILSSIAYTIYYYRVQIKSGFSKIKAAVIKAVKKKTSNENS